MKEAVGRVVRTIERGGRSRWHQRVLATGTDVTGRSAEASALVVAPHPDDETIGCGATVARKRAAGTEVHLITVADGAGSHRSDALAPGQLASIRSGELRDACRILGLSDADTLQLAIADETVADHVADVAQRIGEAIHRHRPDEVLVCSALDWHPDHKACSEAARTAVLDLPPALRPRLLEYPVWWWMHGPWQAAHGGPWATREPVGFAAGLAAVVRNPGAELVSTQGFLATKQQALAAHRSQTSKLFDDESWAVLDDEFKAAFFLSHEIAFPVQL